MRRNDVAKENIKAMQWLKTTSGSKLCWTMTIRCESSSIISTITSNSWWRSQPIIRPLLRTIAIINWWQWRIKTLNLWQAKTLRCAQKKLLRQTTKLLWQTTTHDYILESLKRSRAIRPTYASWECTTQIAHQCCNSKIHHLVRTCWVGWHSGCLYSRLWDRDQFY